MRPVLLTAILLSMTASTSEKAAAFIMDPYITPANPTPDTPISVRVRAGGCHGFTDFPGDAELEQIAPGQLRLITDGIALTPGHPFCIYPDFVYRFDIGKLPAGAYSLQVFIYDDFSAPEPVGFGSVSFRVTEPAKIPASSWSAMLGLFALVAGLGVATLHGCRSDRRWR